MVWSAGLFGCDSDDVELDLKGGVLVVLAARNLGSSSLVTKSLVRAIVASLDWI